MSEITLYKRLYDEMEFESNHGSARYKFEAITAIQRGRQILPLLHFQEMMDGVASYSIAPETIRMPHAVGKRVMEFCQAAYVEGEGGFNCHSFVRAAMGWRENIYHHSYSCPHQGSRPQRGMRQPTVHYSATCNWRLYASFFPRYGTAWLCIKCSRA